MEHMVKSELLTFISKDAEGAFNTIVEEFGDRILRVCMMYLNDLSDSEEVTQEVLIKVYRNIENFKGDSNIYTWIYKITINTCNSYRKKRKFHLPLEEINVLSVESHEEEVILKLRESNLIKILNKLDEKYKTVLFLYYYEELKISEISLVLGKREGTIKTWLSRGKKYLERELLKEGENYE